MGQADRALTAGRTERRRPVGQAGHRGDKQEDRLGRVVSSLAPMQGCASSFSAAATFTLSLLFSLSFLILDLLNSAFPYIRIGFPIISNSHCCDQMPYRKKRNQGMDNVSTQFEETVHHGEDGMVSGSRKMAGLCL